MVLVTSDSRHPSLDRFGRSGPSLSWIGIEPTNDAAERALRGTVIYRKLSIGTQSEGGSRFAERIFSIIETYRLQKRVHRGI
jgi:hypothetical protein